MNEMFKSRFGANLAKTLGSNAFSQIFPILFVPFLTRLYEPWAFGTQALVLSYSALILSVVQPRIDWIISSKSSRAVSAAYLALGILILSLGFVVTVVAVLILAAFTGYVDSQRNAGVVLSFLPVLVALMGLQSLLTSWFVRAANMTYPSVARMAYSISNSLFAVALGLIGFERWGLLAAVSSATVLCIIVLFYGARRDLSLLADRAKRDLGRLAHPVRRRLFLLGGACLVNSAALSLPALLISTIYSEYEVGVFSFVQRIALLPMMAIGLALTQSYWGEVSKDLYVNPDSVQRKKNNLSNLILLASIPIVALSVLVSDYFGLIFGDKWKDVGSFLVIFVPVVVTQMISSPFSSVLVMRGCDRWILGWDLFRLIGLVLLFAFVYHVQIRFVYCLLGYALWMSSAYIIYSAKISHELRLAVRARTCNA